MRLSGIKIKTKASLTWRDQESELYVQARCDTWDGPVQDKELNSAIFVGPSQFSSAYSV